MKRKGQDETGDHIFCFALFFLVTLSVQVAKRSEWLNYMAEAFGHLYTEGRERFWQNKHMKKGKAYGTSY